MTHVWPSLGVQVCSGARESVQALGTSLSSTTLNPAAALAVQHTPGAGAAWYGIPTADLSSLYLFVLLYLQTIHRGDLPGKESAAKAWMMALRVLQPGCFLILSCLNGGCGPVGGWSPVTSQLAQTALYTTNCRYLLVKFKSKIGNPSRVEYFGSAIPETFIHIKWNITLFFLSFWRLQIMEALQTRANQCSSAQKITFPSCVQNSIFNEANVMFSFWDPEFLFFHLWAVIIAIVQNRNVKTFTLFSETLTAVSLSEMTDKKYWTLSQFLLYFILDVPVVSV